MKRNRRIIIVGREDKSALNTCICEGGAERGILELLLDKDKLIFGWDDLLAGEIIRKRDARSFQNEYLRMAMNKKIILYRVLDSRSEKFNLSLAYRDKVTVYNVVTAPEIEMLLIIAENKYKDFKRSGFQKPSDYCKQVLKIKGFKQKEYVKNYFKDIDRLIYVLRKYKSISRIRNSEVTISDLLRDDE